MHSIRIYLPLTHDQLRALASERRLAAPVRGFTAIPPTRTDSRRSIVAAEEEAEFAAFAAAAAAARDSDPGRRVIASADAPVAAIEQITPTEVSTTADLPLRFIVSLHIDEAIATADGGVGGEDPLELLWYDITELDAVIEDLAT